MPPFLLPTQLQFPQPRGNPIGSDAAVDAIETVCLQERRKQIHDAILALGGGGTGGGGGGGGWGPQQRAVNVRGQGVGRLVQEEY